MRTAFSCWNVMIVASVYVCSQFFEDAATDVTPSFDELYFARRSKYDCRVTADIRMVVFAGNRSFTPADQCASNNASSISDLSSMNIFERCLRLLYRGPVHTVRLDEDRYIDITTMTPVSPRSPYRVVCLTGKEKLVQPVITSFTLQLWDDQHETILWGYNLLDSNSTSVTIPSTNNNTLNVSCQASGYPKPQVVITQDNETCDILPLGICLIRPSMQHSIGVLSCRATNVLASTQAHMLVYVSDSETGVSTNQNGKVALVWIVGGVVAALLLVTISIVVIVVKLKRKAAARKEQKRTDNNTSVPRSPCGSNTACRYEIMSSTTSSDTGYVEAVDQHYETTIYKTPDMEDDYRTEYIEITDVQYETSNNSVYANSLISQGDNSDVVYENVRSHI